jgi:hypothetical protein
VFEHKVPWWIYLAVVPLWGTPICVIGWTLFRLSASQWRSALIGFLLGMAGWLAATIAYLAAEFAIQPCLENCSGRYRAPWQDAASFAAILVYMALAVLIVVGLYKSRWSRTGVARRDG